MVESFRGNRWLGQIVGPHGCGKTTLCCRIADELEKVFPAINHVTIRSGRHVQASQLENSMAPQPTRRPAPTLTIVDGVERLSLLQQRMMIGNLARKRGQVPADGLLITSHRQLRFVPVLRRITPSLATLEDVARYLDPALEISGTELVETFERANRNIREAIMLLYDRHESLRNS